MRTCPSCKAVCLADQVACPACGSALAARPDSDSLLDTLLLAPSPGSGGPGRAGAATPLPAPAARTEPRADSLVGARLAERYEVTRKIGEGGMGVVYEARHLLIGKRVAIKVLLEKYVQKDDVVARLQQEARLASSIGHEHIVDITDFGATEDGRTFVVMEFLDGQPLSSLLAQEGPLEPSRAVAILRQVASALGAAHDKGIVHRDVKPENIFLIRRADRDFVKVVDFGISKLMRPAEDDNDGTSSGSPRLTHTGMVLGTPLYMSPEQARGDEVLDHRIDIYAVGVILYELVTGEVPFRGSNYLSIISQVLSHEPRSPRELRPDLGISRALESVILKAMAKDRAVRYQTMAELDADLARVESGAQVGAVTTTQVERQGRSGGIRPGRPLRLVVWASGVGIVITAVAAAIVRLAPEPPSRPRSSPRAIMAPNPIAPTPPRPRFETIVVHVKSDPPGAEVWWKSAKQGITPTDIELPKGSDQIELTLRAPGYQDATAPFYPIKDQDVSVTLTRPAPPVKGGRPPRPVPSRRPPPAAVDPGPTAGGDLKPTPYGTKPR